MAGIARLNNGDFAADSQVTSLVDTRPAMRKFCQVRFLLCRNVREGTMITWLIIGLIAGWLTGKIMHGRGYGVVMDIVLGLIGGVIGGWIFGALGIMVFSLFGAIVMSTIGAVVLVGAVHLLHDAT